MNNKLTCAALLLASGLLLTLAGCGESSRGTSGASKAPPKLDFHKPRNFSLAVERIGSLHEALVTESKFPQPISYTVVEESHAHGDGNAHVHYKILGKIDRGGDHDHKHEVGEEHDHEHADDHDHEHPHEHAHGHSHRDPFDKAAKQHKIVVDAFTEYSDIVRWLPAIAADGDMSADDWKQVKSITKKLTAQLELVTEAGNIEAQHTSYKSKADAIAKIIVNLENLVKPNAAKIL